MMNVPFRTKYKFLFDVEDRMLKKLILMSLSKKVQKRQAGC